jgi:phosphoglycerate dehydrogenase-like enzyme
LDCAHRLVVFGLGYVGTAVARYALRSGFAVFGAVRGSREYRDNDIGLVDFMGAHDVVGKATHILSTVPPDASGDPVLSLYRDAIASAPQLR